jgi:predicted DNA-binding protein
MLYTTLYMVATRTQIYLTTEQRRRLDARGKREGRTLAALIRTAVDAYLNDDSAAVEEALKRTFGSMPDLEPPARSDWDERDNRVRS